MYFLLLLFFFNIFFQIEDIEWESHNIEVLNALKAGTSALNKLHEEMSLEDVERLMEETNEAIQVTLFFLHFIL